MCSSRVHLYQNPRRGKRPKLYLARKSTLDSLQGSKESQVQESWSVPGFWYERVEICPALWVLHGTGKHQGFLPIFDFSKLLQFEDKAFRVVVDTYVTASDGTGIVHQAPGFGEDDHRIAIANGVLRPDEMPPCPVDDKGDFTKEVSDFAGENFKAS